MYAMVSCLACGYFGPAPGGINIDGGTNITVQNGSAPCPNCGRDAPFLDATYDIVGAVVKIALRGNRTWDQLRGLQSILERAQASDAEPEEIQRAIGEEQPWFTGVGSLLPKNKAEFYSVVAIVLSLIMFILQRTDDAAKPSSLDAEQIQQAFERALDHHDEVVEKRASKPARNSHCYCGSGKKYKQCHGAPQPSGRRPADELRGTARNSAEE